MLFKVREGPFDFQELFVTQSYIFGRQVQVTGGEQIFAVEFLILFDFGSVDFQFAALQFFDITPHRPVKHQLALRFTRLLFVESLQFAGEAIKDLLAIYAIQLSLLWVEGYHIPLSAGCLPRHRPP